MAEIKPKVANSESVGTGIAGVAGFAMGAATVAAAMALSTKENRKKAGKVIHDMRNKVMEMKKPAEDKIEDAKDTAEKAAENLKN